MFRRKTIQQRVAVFTAMWVLVFSTTGFGAFFHDAAALAQGVTFAEQFPQVGFVTTVRGSALQGGSGVLIAPDWVLLSGHQIADPGDLTGAGIDEIRFRTGVDPFGVGPDHFRLADAWFVHPGYTLQTIDGVDLALMHLSEPILDIAPSPLFDGPVSIGMEFHGVGYGEHGSVETGLLPRDWIRRAGSNIVTDTSFTSDNFILSSFDSLTNGGMSMEWLSTAGDSGGGWFADVNGEFHLFGTHAGGLGSYGYGAHSAGMPIQPHLDWIHATMAAPEPSTAAFLMMGMTLVVRRRRPLC